MNRFWMDECPDCGGSGGGIDPSAKCFTCRGTGLVEPDENPAAFEEDGELEVTGRG